jgi:hypothetical protein
VNVRGGLTEDAASASLDLARWFATGATMWCAAPAWPSHALHLAVEFVHPVIVGKRALPATIVEGSDLVGALRVGAAAGDVLVAVADAADPAVCEAMRRAPAWGLRTIWIGCGDRPPAGAADHVLWTDEGLESCAYGGGFVLLYHLLWELTHVCFEHPGLLQPQPAANGGEGDVCITCSDEGRLAEVVSAGPGSEAQVRTASGIEGVDTTLIGAPRPGDLVLVHAGCAVATVEA